MWNKTVVRRVLYGVPPSLFCPEYRPPSLRNPIGRAANLLDDYTDSCVVVFAYASCVLYFYDRADKQWYLYSRPAHSHSDYLDIYLNESDAPKWKTHPAYDDKRSKSLPRLHQSLSPPFLPSLTSFVYPCASSATNVDSASFLTTQLTCLHVARREFLDVDISIPCF